MEKKDLYLGDEARGAIRDRIKYGEPYHNIKYGDSYPNAGREESIYNAVAVASADYAVKKVIEKLNIDGKLGHVNVHNCCQLCGTQVIIDTDMLREILELVEELDKKT